MSLGFKRLIDKNSAYLKMLIDILKEFTGSLSP